MRNEQELPLVSAIITTLQRPQLVTRAIKSVLNQTYPNIELIVIVDGPDDATVERLSTLSDTRMRTVVLPKNVGLGEARNAGVRECHGEWVAFLDDDDEWLSEKIAIQIESALHSGPEINFVASRFEERTADRSRIRPKDFPAPGEHWSESFYCNKVLLLPSTFLVKKSLMMALPFTLRRHEDADWLLRGQAAGVFHSHWVSDALTVYHCEATQNRLSTHAAWKERHEWYVSNPTLLTKKSVPYYIGMICIPEAKRSPAPLRACSFLLKEVVLRGKLTVGAIGYLAMVTLSSPGWRSSLRNRVTLLQRRTDWQGTFTKT